MARVDAAWEAAWPGAGAQQQQQQPLQQQLLPPQQPPSPTSAAAIAAALAAGSTRSDFKLVLPLQEAQRLLGGAACAALASALALCAPPPAPPALPLRCLTFALRRTQGQGRWIGWHYDQAGLTAAGALNGGSGSGSSSSAAQAVVGGQVAYLLADGALLAPQRLPGRVVAHHGDVAHGVTRLVSGVRYGLFALVAREDVANVA